MTKKIWKALDNLSPSDVKLSQLPRKPDGLYNMHLNEYGQLEKRAGYAEYHPTSIGADYKISGLHRFYKMETLDKVLLAVWNTDIYKFTDVPTAGSWDVQYLCSVEPDAADPVWTLGGTDYSSCSAGILTLDTSANVTRTCFYYKSPDVDFDGGFLVQFKAQMVSSVGDYPFIIRLHDGTQNQYTTLYLKTDSIYYGTTKVCDFDTTDDYHIYKLVIIDSTATLYIDDTNKGSWAVIQLGSLGDLFRFGDESSTSSCKIYIDYLYYTNDFTTVLTPVSIKSSLTASSNTYFADFYNHCYIVNGGDAMMKYDGDNVRTVGITVLGAPTGVSDVDGSLTEGIYYYKYTFVDEDGYESNGGTASAAITALAHPNDGVTLTIAVSSDAKIAKRRIYRTTSGGAIYYYEGEVADNTTTTYESTTADATISLNAVLHTDHTAPPCDPHLIAKRRNRLYLGHDSEVCISHLSDREYFPAAWFIYTGNRGKVKGLIEAEEDLAVLTDDTLERLTNYDEDSFEMQNSFSPEGCIAQRSLVDCDNLICYLGFDGIHWFNGINDGIFSKALNKYIKDNIVDIYAYLSCATYWDDKYILCYPKTGGTYPTETIWVDLKNRTYGVYSFAFSCFSKWDKGRDGLQLKGGSNTAGRVYSVFSGLDDDDSAITCYDKPEPIDMGKPEIWKQFYHIYIKVKSTTGTALRFYYTLDDATETYKDLTLTADKTLWYKITLAGGGQRGRAITLRPYVSDKYAVTYMGYAIAYEEEAPEYA